MCIPASIFEYDNHKDWVEKNKKEETIDRTWDYYSGLPGVGAYIDEGVRGRFSLSSEGARAKKSS